MESTLSRLAHDDTRQSRPDRASPDGKCTRSLADRLFYPVQSHSIPFHRAWSIALRTIHLMATGILLGGHAFHAPVSSLRPMLYLAIVSGAGMAALESYPNLHFLTEGGGVMVLAKLALLCTIPFAWDHRFPILLVVVAIASIGSHMPARFRHYSFVYGADVHKGKCSAGKTKVK